MFILMHLLRKTEPLNSLFKNVDAISEFAKLALSSKQKLVSKSGHKPPSV